MVINIAIPNKGRLADGALDILHKIGLKAGGAQERRLLARLGDKYAVLFVRASDIPEFVQRGVADVGITGIDQVIENKAEVEKLLDLNFGHCRLVLAVPDSSPVKSLDDVPEGATIATSYPNQTRKFFEENKKKVKIVNISGAAEVTPHIGVADMVVDLTETGSTLILNKLRPVHNLLDSCAVFIANRKSLEEKAKKIGEIRAALESVISASKKRYVMANVQRDKLDEVSALIPGVSGPTVMELAGSKDMVAIHAVADEEDINGIIAMLKSLGATGILVLPIERMVH
jgi:ATP phosphoribosyltransferase